MYGSSSKALLLISLVLRWSGIYTKDRIFFASITPSNLFVPLIIFQQVFTLYLFISLGILQSGIFLNNTKGCHFTNFIIKLVGYLNINLRKPKFFPLSNALKKFCNLLLSKRLLNHNKHIFITGHYITSAVKV